MSGESAEPRRLLSTLAALAALAVALHAANLAHLAGAFDCAFPSLVCASGGDAPWPGRDTSAYRAAAEDIRQHGVFGASWLKRIPGYPLLLLCAESVGGSDAAALWASALAAGLAAGSIGWLAWWLSGSVAAAGLAALLFCAWPNALQYTARLLTDGVHGHLAVTAVATTLCWRVTGKRAAAGAAALAWVAVQLLRPTFFAIGLLLPLLLWPRAGDRSDSRISLALGLIVFLVPVTISSGNLLRHGAALPPVACYAAPRLEARLALAERPPEERVPAVERALFAHLRKRCMERYRVDPARQAASDRRFLREHPAAGLASLARELVDQGLYPLRPYAKPGMEPLYAGWPYPAAGQKSAPLALFWLVWLAGLGLVFRRDRLLAVFLALVAALVMGPATNAHLVGARLRYPVDLLALPVVVAAGAALATRLRARARRAPPGAAR